VNAGYLDEVVEPEELMTKALEVAKDLATLSHPHYKLTKDLDQKDVVKRINDSIAEMANPF
jgi:enoyl-CoA hydratase/carnithine racemase